MLTLGLRSLTHDQITAKMDDINKKPRPCQRAEGRGFFIVCNKEYAIGAIG